MLMAAHPDADEINADLSGAGDEIEAADGSGDGSRTVDFERLISVRPPTVGVQATSAFCSL